MPRGNDAIGQWTLTHKEPNGMHLTDAEKEMRAGALGEAPRLCLEILLSLGEALGAQRMTPVAQVQTDSGFYQGDAGLEFVEKLADLDARVMVPTTMNAAAVDLERGHEYNVPDGLREKCRRLETAHQEMGAIPTWTCAPYQDGLTPRFGDAIAASESNAIAFANSVIGARTNRVGDLMDICAAITGRFPAYGLYRPQNRKARLRVRLSQLTAESQQSSLFYPILGYYLGARLGTRIAAVEGIIPASAGVDRLKDLCAALASSGPVALIHLIGVTPEAQTPEMCFGRTAKVEELVVSPRDLAEAENHLATTSTDELDWVAFGCPHFSLRECVRIGQLLNGRRVSGNVAVTVFTSRTIMGWIEQTGLASALRSCGVTFFTDGCLLGYPQKGSSVKAMMSNSAKAANYVYSQSGCQAAIGSIADCVESAVAGKIVKRKSPWAK
jgi:predicted aconitase